MQEKLFQNLLIKSKQLYIDNKKKKNTSLQLSTQHPKQTGMKQCRFNAALKLDEHTAWQGTG
jgi:FtsZ-binding cell division protein ZapB